MGASFPFCMACGVRVNDFCLFEGFDQRGSVLRPERRSVLRPEREVFFDQRGEVFFDQVEEYQEGHWLWGRDTGFRARLFNQELCCAEEVDAWLEAAVCGSAWANVKYSV